VNKAHQLADWRVRPLDPALLAYARQDTHHLLYIADRLKVRVGMSKRCRRWRLFHVGGTCMATQGTGHRWLNGPQIGRPFGLHRTRHVMASDPTTCGRGLAQMAAEQADAVKLTQAVM
jgi:hypothetical protein